jgi:hypothetical protein
VSRTRAELLDYIEASIVDASQSMRDLNTALAELAYRADTGRDAGREINHHSRRLLEALENIGALSKWVETNEKRPA